MKKRNVIDLSVLLFGEGVKWNGVRARFAATSYIPSSFFDLCLNSIASYIRRKEARLMVSKVDCVSRSATYKADKK